MKPGDVVLVGIKSQGIVSRAIKLGSILRYQPKVALAATVAQGLCVLAAIVLSVLLGWSVLGAAAAVCVALATGIVLVWVIAAVAGDHSAYWARFSHAALVTEAPPAPLGATFLPRPGFPQAWLTEALKDGVITRGFSYRERNYTHIPVPMSDEDRAQVLEFARSVVEAKTRYGFVVFASLALYCITASLTFMPTLILSQAGTAICSGFVADALTRAGVIWDKPPFFVMPADIAAHFKVE